MCIDNLLYKIYRFLSERYGNLTIKENVLRQIINDDSLICGQNALVHNHGSNSQIMIGTGVILDGVLECYEKGEITVNDYTYVGRSRIFAAQKINIGKGVLISDHVVIMDSDLHAISAKRRFQDMKEWRNGIFPDVYTNIHASPVFIGDYAWIAANSVILKSVTIGEGAVIGAGSVVTKDVPPWTIVAGNPARVIREISPDER